MITKEIKKEIQKAVHNEFEIQRLKRRIVHTEPENNREIKKLNFCLNLFTKNGGFDDYIDEISLQKNDEGKKFFKLLSDKYEILQKTSYLDLGRRTDLNTNYSEIKALTFEIIENYIMNKMTGFLNREEIITCLHSTFCDYIFSVINRNRICSIKDIIEEIIGELKRKINSLTAEIKDLKKELEVLENDNSTND